ncbi:MAG: transglutaminase [Candidatus Viridilinea halotolerans]|uniref:Transglutaminase n=1 Tax=Candidatus Viridilinea halotolerans TaxID=2491704 RepID=A0A426U9V8_9CHLR|nr:MAG: transglutaminase [Candidatus Viridilinea halotolerans]
MATTTHPQPKLSRELTTTLPGALLLLLMVSPVVWALAISNWAPGLEVLRPMALLGLLAGIVFARLPQLPGWVAHPLSAALAFTWAIQLLSPLMDERLTTWRDQATELLIRTIIWARVIIFGGRGEDILLFVFVLCLLVWLLAYSSAWMVLRQGWIWPPILLNGLVALINYTYVLPKPTLAFFIFLAAALLLLVYQHIVQRQALWDAFQIEYPDLLVVRFLASAAIMVGLLLTMTAALPGEVSLERATRTWDTLSSPFRTARERWEDLFSTLNAPPGAGSGAFTTGTAALGGARHLTTDLVMEVRSTEYDYWRGTAFDRYTGSDWQNTVGEQARAILGAASREQVRTPRGPAEPIPLLETRARRPVAQTFTLASDRLDDLIMVGGSATSVSVATQIEHNYRNEGSALVANYDETALIVSQERLRAGQIYTVTALVSGADVASLRAAGSDYPAWVRERYLQLPATVSERTYELASRLVDEAGARTPYDVALLYQNYLRTLPYNENIPSPPPGADHVDWFLFTQREGYCDYFASAMVVLLRAQGIPARWVRGYAGGEFDAERGIYMVRENVAHSWPEVYFPGYGWERFEPTAASYTNAPLRPLTAAMGSDTDEPSIPPPPPEPVGNLDDLDAGLEQNPAPDIIVNPGSSAPAAAPGRDLRRIPALLGSIIGSAVLLWGLMYGRWRYELRGLSRATAAYAGMALLARWGGLRQGAEATPLEYGATLAAALPEQRPTIERIVSAYAREQYGGPYGAHMPLPNLEALRALHVALLRRIVVRG